MSDANRLPFVQVEHAGSVGLEDARYLARDPEQVLVVRVAGAPKPGPRRLRKPKPKEVEPEPEPATVPLTVLTVIRGERLGDEAAASAWLERLRGDSDAVGAEIAAALAVINSAIQAYRVTSLDHGIADVTVEGALSVRVGYGDGDDLADGRWDAAIELPGAERRRRLEVLAPQERIAAVLGGRETTDVATGPLLRARTDLDAGRMRDAALQVRIGLEAMLADEASFGHEDQADDLAALDARRKITGEAANEALAGELGEARAAEVTETLAICERVLRRRRVYW